MIKKKYEFDSTKKIKKSWIYSIKISNLNLFYLRAKIILQVVVNEIVDGNDFVYLNDYPKNDYFIISIYLGHKYYYFGLKCIKAVGIY